MSPDSSIALPAGHPDVGYLSPAEHLVRASMAIRGVRPSAREISLVAERPGALDDLVDLYLEDPRFGLRIREMHNENLLLQTDTDDQLPSVGDMTGTLRWDMHDAATTPALRLIERVVMEDRPYTEIVTADWMLTNHVLAGIYGLPYDPEGPEWQESVWVDGRRMAGILSDAEFYRRHQSNGSNFHRGRANVLADQLLCESFATRDVVVEGGIDLSDEEAVAQAVMEMPTCIGCHQALDPLAGFMWGFQELALAEGIRSAHSRGCSWPADNPENPTDQFPEDYCYPLVLFQPAEEGDWQEWGLRPPGYYGQPGEGLDQLGAFMADDPRFAQCAATRFYSYLTQTSRDDVPFELSAHFQGVLESNQFSAKSLVKAIVLSDPFRARRALDADPAHHVPAVQTVRPEAYGDLIEELTGFRWVVDPQPGGCDECWGPVDLTTTDTYGFRAMAGGVDSMAILSPVHTATPVKLLTMDRLAAEAAAYVVRTDHGGKQRYFASDPALLTSAEEVPSGLSQMHVEVLGMTPSDEQLADLQALWDLAFGEEQDATAAWTLCLAALLQDPALVYY